MTVSPSSIHVYTTTIVATLEDFSTLCYRMVVLFVNLRKFKQRHVKEI
jgi:hypothetical protein